MRFQLLSLVLLLSTNVFGANGRSPAVEDFVGIEIEEVEAPPGSEVLFNLEKDISRIETVRKEGPVQASAAPSTHTVRPWSASALFGIAFIFGLPILSWMLIMHHLKSKAGKESTGNIEVLEKYRCERAAARKNEETKRKVS